MLLVTRVVDEVENVEEITSNTQYERVASMRRIPNLAKLVDEVGLFKTGSTLLCLTGPSLFLSLSLSLSLLSLWAGVVVVTAVLWLARRTSTAVYPFHS